MKRWARARYQLNLPLEGRSIRVTGCQEHLDLAREAGREGMVLLKNENKVLPLTRGSKVALFGKGVFDYVKGGGGSGDVTVSHIYNLFDGIQLTDSAEVYAPLADFYKKEVDRQYKEGSIPGMLIEPELPCELLCGAKEFTDTAIIVISRFSGEGWDRIGVKYQDQTPDEAQQTDLSQNVFENSDFCLTNAEAAMVKAVKENFAKVVVVLNIGGMMDTSWFACDDRISSALLAWQGGMEGGLSMADILFGVKSPSGKLVDTFAGKLEDYPSTETFHASHKYVEYNEDIYVGYRYFETMEAAKDKVIYPFGYGLSYTTFEVNTLFAGEKDGNIVATVQVKNTGDCAGKEVVQMYYSAPQGLLGKPAKELAAFQKTDELKPGEEQMITLTFPATAMASFDDLGKVAKSAYVLEKGVYNFYIGTSVRDCEELAFAYGVDEDIVTEQLTSLVAPTQLTKRMLSDGSYEEIPQGTPADYMENAIGWEGFDSGYLTPAVRAVKNFNFLDMFMKGDKIELDDVADGKNTLDEFMAQLSVEQMVHMLGGQPNTGVANTFGYGNLPEYGVPNIMTADGPAGLRIQPGLGIYTTAFPIASQLASTWNPELVQAVGAAGAKEVKENNIYVWLTPAVNIHRSPLCGRNFEYYSEDPLVAGLMAAAMVDGIQSQGVAAEVKHFCANDKETNRKNSDSRVSERALREIYLKQFEIIVKKSQPWALMTAYNLVNGQRCSENKELLDGILRGEWGFEGVVTTDWWTYGEHYKETKAGNDIKMGTGFPERVMKAYEAGAISEEEIAVCARRVLELILKMD
ncbi:MAG: glycoside hydrolase family 3 C-terminal domain-containing protein [Clostridiales bacterium]|nr:glycoside hydrolase family 3 C-terminal domain-containing protein [Candidatus Blautia equi]